VKLRVWSLFLLGACSRSHSGEDLSKVSCLGPPDALFNAVYLHGIDSPSPGDLELANRKNLAAIAEALSLRIALPRASTPCPEQTDMRCWGWSFDQEQLTAGVRAIDQAAQTCFKGRRYGLIGFSNGGFFVGRLLRTCAVRAKVPWMLTMGSSVLNGPLEAEPRSLAGCGHLVMLAGNGDSDNAEGLDHMVKELRAKGADVVGSRYDGGHEMPSEALRAALRPLLWSFP
jgi:predicted esterase